MQRIVLIGILSATVSISANAQPATSAWSGIERELGRPGAVQADGPIKFSFPRSDLSVKIGDLALKPAFALGSWVGFNRPGIATVMGDLVLLESEVPGVIDALQRGGVQQTALHNHLLNESPRVMYMHISAHGRAIDIARAIHAALATTGTPLAPPGAAPAIAMASGLDTAAIASALGFKGKLNGVVYQVAVPRLRPITMGYDTIPNSMGLASAINFQSAGGGNAAITGDFVMIASEVNPVIQALRAGGVAVTALHSHILDESPRLFFMHFWAVGEPATLAKTLNSALNRMAVKH